MHPVPWGPRLSRIFLSRIVAIRDLAFIPQPCSRVVPIGSTKLNRLPIVLFVIAISWVSAGAQRTHHLSEDQKRVDGVDPAAPEMISFERIAPLLDGLFEDAAAIQAK